MNDLEMNALAIDLVRARFSWLYRSNVVLDLLLDVWTASREARSAKHSWASLPQAPMMAKRVKGTIRAESTIGAIRSPYTKPPLYSRPTFIRSKCKPKATEGMAVSHEVLTLTANVLYQPAKIGQKEGGNQSGPALQTKISDLVEKLSEMSL
eukprot:Em0011g535a